jgi:hypothetical protein
LAVANQNRSVDESTLSRQGLLDDGHMALSDGRRLETLPDHEGGRASAPSDVIPIHPGFRAVVLANRPGFPFLGNDFFAECGDVQIPSPARAPS